MPEILARPSLLAVLVPIALVGPDAAARDPQVVQNPSHDPAPGPRLIDLSTSKPRVTRTPGVRFSDLDRHRRAVEPREPTSQPVQTERGDGMVQLGGMVVPDAMLDGAAMVPDAARSLTDGADPRLGGVDLSEICAYPDEVPPGIYDHPHRPGGEFPRFHTIYLNFTGEPDGLYTGGENSAENLSSIALSGHPYPEYGGGQDKAIAVAQAVAADFEDWAVRVVYLERPPKVLPYTMVMVGGHHSDTTAGPSGGVAPLDCEDVGQRNVCYAFDSDASVTTQANIVSQEIGHTMGLGHTYASDSVMAAGYAPTQPGDLGFGDSCASALQLAGQAVSCTGVNRCHCGVPDQQHDRQTLSTTLYPAGVDTTAPTISMLQPPDGAEFQPEDTIRVEFDPWDDVSGYAWGLVIEDESGQALLDQVDYDRSLVFDLMGLPPGEYTLTAYIQDHADHVATHSVGIRVAGDEALDGSGGGSDDTGQDPDAPGTTGDEDTGTGEDGELDPGDDAQGCDCATGVPTPLRSLGLLGLLGLRRRRRTSRRYTSPTTRW